MSAAQWGDHVSATRATSARDRGPLSYAPPRSRPRSVLWRLRWRRADAGGFPALAPLEVPPLPRQGPAESEAGALVGEPVGGGPVADVDRQALHVHRSVGREDPPQGLFERSPLADLGLQQ